MPTNAKSEAAGPQAFLNGPGDLELWIQALGAAWAIRMLRILVVGSGVPVAQKLLGMVFGSWLQRGKVQGFGV